MRHGDVSEGRVVLVAVLAAIGCAGADEAPCTAPLGVYRVEWLDPPADCRPVVEAVERLWIDAEGDCASADEWMGDCSLSLDSWAPHCIVAFQGGFMRLAGGLARTDRRRFEGQVDVQLGDFLRDFRGERPTYRECDLARVALVHEGEGPMPDPPEDSADGRASGDACLASCDPGLLCARAEDSVSTGFGQCVAIPSAGVPCASSVHADRLPRCAEDFYCDETSICRAFPEAGEACGSSLGAGARPICGQDGYCAEDGLCRAHPALDEPCITDWHHASAGKDCTTVPCCRVVDGFCDLEAPGGPTCVPWLALGEPCRTDAILPYVDDCAPGLACACRDLGCRWPCPDCADRVCVEYRDYGEPCDDVVMRCNYSTQCVDGRCR